jgi:PAS domain S-box-containing protein
MFKDAITLTLKLGIVKIAESCILASPLSMQNLQLSSSALNNDIFRTLIEESPTPIGLYEGREMVIKLVNKSILSVWSKDETIIGKTFREALPELEGQPFFQILDDVFTTGIAYEATEDRVDLLSDGKLQTFYFNFTYKPLKTPEGKVWGILNTAADVTELVVTRQKLAEAEERTRLAIAAAEIGTWDFDLQNQTVQWDERCKELSGFARTDEIQLKDVRQNIDPEDSKRVEAQILKAFNAAGDGAYSADFRTINANNGQIKWVRCKGKAYFNDAGKCVRFAGTILDISKEVQDSEEKEKLVALIENSDDVIGVADLDTQITYLNKAGRRLLGRGDEDIHKPSAEYFIPDDRSRLEEMVRPSLYEKGSWSGEMRYRHFKTNESLPVYLNAFRIDDPLTGKPIAMASVARDLRPEKSARNEQFKLLTLIDHSSDFISLSDADGNVSYVNAAGRTMMGLEKAGDVMRHNSEYIIQEEKEKLKNLINQALLTKGKWSGEITYRNFTTGEPIPVFATTMLVYDSAGDKPQGRATIARDLRREIADKKALTESERLLKNITDAAPIALWMSDNEGEINYVNQTWIDWTGLTFEENMGRGWTTAILPGDRQRAGEKFISDLTAQRPYEVDFRLQNRDGEIRWCIATGNPQYRADGSFAGYIGACTDITEKTVAEQQLHLKNHELNEQISQFEFVTDFMPVQLWTANTNGELDYVNKRTLDFFGLPSEKIIGAEWLNHIHPDDRAQCMETWVRSLQSGKLYQFEFRLKNSEGVYKWHLARALPFVIDGKVIKWFGTNTDIDEQKQLQRQKDDFLGIASHELKTPVTSIKAYAQVLGAMLSKEGDSKKAGMVLRMDAQVNRLTNLIGDLLDVTKINSGKLQFNKTWFDFNQAIKETVEDLQHTTQKHQLIEYFTKTGKIFADKDRIGQVVTNLITNAIKYSPHANRIIISTKLENKEVSVCVQDFGIGIPGDKWSRVFEQFYRVSGDKQHTFPGLGLGLYISSEIIKREGGKMWVNSEEGKGSTFCFSLPVNYEGDGGE